jgi:erythritol kinase
MRAVYEGLAFAARDCYLATGSIPAEVRLGGGAARSKAIRVILASVLGADVRTVKREETGAAGAVMMAAVNLGLYPDLASCAEAWVTPSLGEATPPDPTLVPLYAELFDVYRSIRQAMPSSWARLNAIRLERTP